MNNKLLCVGVITAAHGIKGQVKVKSFTSPSDKIFKYGPLYLQGKKCNMSKVAQYKDQYICSIEGIITRNMSEELKQEKIYIDRNLLPDTEEEEFYIEDLKGLAVRNIKGKVVGNIVDVHNFGGGDIIEIAFNKGEVELFPFTKEIFPELDIDNNIVVFNAPKFVED